MSQGEVGFLARVNLHDDCAEGGQQVGAAVHQGQRFGPQPLILGRRDVDQVKRRAAIAFQKGEAVRLGHSGALGQVAMLEIGLDGLHGFAVAVEEVGMGRAAAERLDADAARAAKEIEHAYVIDPVAQDAEQCFFGAVGDGAGAVAGDGLEFVAAGAAGNDAHGMPRVNWPVLV